MKKHLLGLAILSACLPAAAQQPPYLYAATRPVASASTTDYVPDGSGLYDAVALLADQHLLPPGAPDATDMLGVSHRLWTRGELAAIIAGVTQEPTDPRARAALDFARNTLAPELGHKSGAGLKGATFGPTGFIEPVEEGHSDESDSLDSRGYILGRGRLLGTIGRDGTYTISATNIYTETRDHQSFTTADGGHAGGDSGGVLNGIDEAYASVYGSHGFLVSAGLIRRDWGPSYRGDLLVSDNGPAHPSVQVELPLKLGKLGAYRFTEYEETYNNAGTTIYEGGRRLEHPIGDRVTLDLQEGYNSNQFKGSQTAVLVIPYYTYQGHFYSNNEESQHFNYLANAGLTVQPEGPTGPSRAYGQLLVDDLKAPFGLGKGNSVPRKVGYLLGVARTFRQTGTDAVVEFTHTDRAVYTDNYPELAWFNDNLPTGSPVGPNGNEIFGRIGQRLGRRITSFVSYRNRTRSSDDFPAPADRALDLGLDYHLAASRSIGLQYSYYREDPFTGTVPNNPYGGPELPGVFGGAADGERLRRSILGIDFLQSF